MPEKQFKGILVLNWKTGSIRIVKKRLNKIGAFEIPVNLDINVIIPEMKEIVAKGEIVVPDHVVNKMMIEAI